MATLRYSRHTFGSGRNRPASLPCPCRNVEPDFKHVWRLHPEYRFRGKPLKWATTFKHVFIAALAPLAMHISRTMTVDATIRRSLANNARSGIASLFASRVPAAAQTWQASSCNVTARFLVPCPYKNRDRYGNGLFAVRRQVGKNFFPSKQNCRIE